jgi:hypothetical protein
MTLTEELRELCFGWRNEIKRNEEEIARLSDPRQNPPALEWPEYNQTNIYRPIRELTAASTVLKRRVERAEAGYLLVTDEDKNDVAWQSKYEALIARAARENRIERIEPAAAPSAKNYAL